jgi:hypothetical protein
MPKSYHGECEPHLIIEGQASEEATEIHHPRVLVCIIARSPRERRLVIREQASSASVRGALMQIHTRFACTHGVQSFICVPSLDEEQCHNNDTELHDCGSAITMG